MAGLSGICVDRQVGTLSVSGPRCSNTCVSAPVRNLKILCLLPSCKSKKWVQGEGEMSLLLCPSCPSASHSACFAHHYGTVMCIEGLVRERVSQRRLVVSPCALPLRTRQLCGAQVSPADACQRTAQSFALTPHGTRVV